MGCGGLALFACVLAAAIPGCVWGKLCCDQDCRHPVSYGRTVMRHITKDEGFLSYPASAIVTIFSKDVLTNEQGEYWEAEIQGKRGLILNRALKELTFKCEPSVHIQKGEEFTEDPQILDDGVPADGTVPTGHAHSDTPTPVQLQQRSDDRSQPDVPQPTPDPQPPPHTQHTPQDTSHPAQDAQPPPDTQPPPDAPPPPVTQPPPPTQPPQDSQPPPPTQPLPDQPPQETQRSPHHTHLPPDSQPPPPTHPQPNSQPPSDTHHPTPDTSHPPQPPHDTHHLSPTLNQPTPTLDDPQKRAEDTQQAEARLQREEEERQSVSDEYSWHGEGSPAATISEEPTAARRTPEEQTIPISSPIEPDATVIFSTTIEPVVETPVVTRPTGHTPLQEEPKKAEDLPENEYQPPPVFTAHSHEPPEEYFDSSTPLNSANKFEGNLEGYQKDESAPNERPPQESTEQEGTPSGDSPPASEGQSTQTEESPPPENQHTQTEDSPPAPKDKSAQTGDSPRRQVVFSEEDDKRYWDDVDEEEWVDEQDELDNEDQEFDEGEDDFEEDREPSDEPPRGEEETTMATPVTPVPSGGQQEDFHEKPPTASPTEPPILEESAPLPPFTPPLPDSDPSEDSDPSAPSDTERTADSSHATAEDEKQEAWGGETDEDKGSENEDIKDVNEDRGSDEEEILSPRESEEERIRREQAQRLEEMQQLYREQRESRRQQELLERQYQQEEREEDDDERPRPQHHEGVWPDQQDHPHDQFTTTFSEQSTFDTQPVPTVTTEEVATPTLQATPIQQDVDETHPLSPGDTTPCDCPEVAPPPCNCPDVTPPPCNCPDAIPPPCPKVGVAEYFPLPGSETGLLWYLEQYRVYVREMVFASLPESVAEWIIENRPMMGVVCVTVAFVSLSVPLLLVLCMSCCSGKGGRKQVNAEKAVRVRLEGEKVKLEGERNDLDHRLRESTATCQGLEDDLRLLRGEMAQLDQAKKQLQTEHQRTTETLTAAQQELTQYQTYTEQLNTQLATLNSQLEETAVQRDEGLKKVEELGGVVVELQSQVGGMEAQKEQLEQDKYTTQSALDTLQAEHEETTGELTELKEQYSITEAKLGTVTSDLEACHVTLRDKEDEVAHLKDCLSQLTDQVAESAVDGEVDGREAQLAKIKAMLDTSKAQQELQRVMAERDEHLNHLQEKTSQLEQQTADNVALRDQLSQLEAKERSTAQELRELQIKMKGVTEYFQEKESGLHRKIELGEINQQRYKSLETEAQEKAAASELEREREKEELKELRKQMADIEKSFLGQLKSNEERAEDALVQLRRTEQELRQANREVTTLKKRLAEAEAAAAHPPPMVRPIPRPHPGGPHQYPPPQQRSRPPSTGPLGHAPKGPSPQPPRPTSAPRLEPRTSSPANNQSMTEPLPPEGSMHKSHSYSIPSTAPRPQSEHANRPLSRGSAESAVPHPAGPARKGVPPRQVSRDQMPPGPLPKLEEHPPQQYGVSPYPVDAPGGQRPPQAPPTAPPTSHDRGYPPPDGPRRPYPPARPPYGVPPPSRVPVRSNYRPPPPGPRPPRPGYPVPPHQQMPRPPMSGQPRPPPMQQGQMPGEPPRPSPMHMAGPPPQEGQPGSHQPSDSNFAV